MYAYTMCINKQINIYIYIYTHICIYIYIYIYCFFIRDQAGEDSGELLRGAVAPGRLQGCWLKDTVKGAQLEETKPQILFDPNVSKNIIMIRRKVKSCILEIP